MAPSPQGDPKFPLPLALFERLPRALAEQVEQRLTAEGFDVTLSPSPKRPRDYCPPGVVPPRSKWATLLLVCLATIGVCLLTALFYKEPERLMLYVLCAVGLPSLGAIGQQRRRNRAIRAARAAGRPLPRLPARSVRSTLRLQLRKSPVRLPALDPLVRRLQAVLAIPMAMDVRGAVGRLADLLARFAGARARAGEMEKAQLAMYLEPIEGLAQAIERQVQALSVLDATIADDGLDDSRLSRALAQSELRREPPESRQALLEDLDRLRDLEDRRARILIALLRTSSLLRRALTLALSEVQEDADYLAEARQLLALPDGVESSSRAKT